MATKEENLYNDVYLQPSRPMPDVYGPAAAYMMMPATAAPLPGPPAGIARTPSMEACSPTVQSSFGPHRVYRASQPEHYAPYSTSRMPRAFTHAQSLPSGANPHSASHYNVTPTASYPATPFSGAPSAQLLHAQPVQRPPELKTVTLSPDNVASSGPLPFDRDQVANQPVQHVPFPTPSPSSNGTCSPLGIAATTRASTSANLPPHHIATPGQGALPNCCYDNNLSTVDRESDYSGASDRATPPVAGRMSRTMGMNRQTSLGESHEEDEEDFSGSDNGQAFPLTARGRKLKSTDEFTRVPGRLSLLGANSKYMVTVGEVRRRLAPPECLNASLLGGVLRKAKAKNGGHDLRKALDEIGLSLPAGRRKATPTTMLTSLVEEEARLLAAQFNDVCSSMFPVAEVANTIAQQHTMQNAHPYFIEDRQRSIQSAMQMTSELRHLLDTFLQQEQEELLADDGGKFPPTSHFGLRQFSLITHGFGLPVVNGVLVLFQSFLNALMKTSSGVPIRDEHALHNVPNPMSSRARRPMH